MSLRGLAIVLQFMRLGYSVMPLIAAGVIGLLGYRVLAAANTQAQDKQPQSASATNSPATNAPVIGAESGNAEKKCIDCHGPFDKLIAASTNYVAPSGEKTSPHRYVPHDSRLAKDVPDCGNCHTAHPLSPSPAKGSIDLSKVNVQWCYEACHHEKNLKSCKECHP